MIADMLLLFPLLLLSKISVNFVISCYNKIEMNGLFQFC